MDNRSEVREFLVSRRGLLTPDRAALPAYGGLRRVPGLRREEVALLAGVSVVCYTRLERGNLAGVSDSVREALATALQLDEAERTYRRDLAQAGNLRPGHAHETSRCTRDLVDRLVALGSRIPKPGRVATPCGPPRSAGEPDEPAHVVSDESTNPAPGSRVRTWAPP